MQKLALVLSFALLSGAVDAQAASYTYIDQKAPYQNWNPPMLTALNLPKVGTSFQVQVPAGWSSGFASASYWLGFGVSNPNAPFPLWMGFLYTSADVVVATPRRPTAQMVTMSFPIPNSTQLLGVRFFQQVLRVADLGPAHTRNLSRGGVGVIGT